MNWKKGDRVKFLDEEGEGIVQEIQKDGLVLVRTDSGFDMPMLAQDLIPVAPLPTEETLYDVRGAGKSTSTLSVAVSPTTKKICSSASSLSITPIRLPNHEQQMLYLGFSPLAHERLHTGPWWLYLINGWECDSFITVGYVYRENTIHAYHGMVPAQSVLCVGEINYEQIKAYNIWEVQALYWGNGTQQVPPPLMKRVEVNVVRFTRSGAFQDNSFSQHKMLLVKVIDEMQKMILEHLAQDDLQDVLFQAKPEPKIPPPPKDNREEIKVDLHYHALDTPSNDLNAAEILNLQRRVFIRELDKGLASPTARRFIAIHGVGNGRLRQEIIQILNTEYPDLCYEDAPFKGYGVGATLIILKGRKRKRK